MQTVSTAKPVVSDLATVQFPSEYRPLPASLLKSADALFAAGGYREAASAYAHLTVHYGNHDELAVRRFLALVASGDCSQAAVLFELASASEQPLLVSALPGGGLMELYGVHAQQRQTHVEYLADYALKNPNDSVALAMVGTWLELDDQPERAQPFFQQAAKLSPESALPGSTPIVASRLVLTDSAR